VFHRGWFVTVAVTLRLLRLIYCHVVTTFTPRSCVATVCVTALFCRLVVALPLLLRCFTDCAVPCVCRVVTFTTPFAVVVTTRCVRALLFALPLPALLYVTVDYLRCFDDSPRLPRYITHVTFFVDLHLFYHFQLRLLRYDFSVTVTRYAAVVRSTPRHVVRLTFTTWWFTVARSPFHPRYRLLRRLHVYVVVAVAVCCVAYLPRVTFTTFVDCAPRLMPHRGYHVLPVTVTRYHVCVRLTCVYHRCYPPAFAFDCRYAFNVVVTYRCLLHCYVYTLLFTVYRCCYVHRFVPLTVTLLLRLLRYRYICVPVTRCRSYLHFVVWLPCRSVAFVCFTVALVYRYGCARRLRYTSP